MTKLEDLKRGTTVRGVLPDSLVTVVDVKWYGSAAIELTYKDAAGKPAEISEIITHLAFYSGWENAMSAVAVAKRVFTDRKIAPRPRANRRTSSPFPWQRLLEARDQYIDWQSSTRGFARSWKWRTVFRTGWSKL